MTSRPADPGIAHPTVVPASADDEHEGTPNHAEDEACPECGRRVPDR